MRVHDLRARAVLCLLLLVAVAGAAWLVLAPAAAPVAPRPLAAAHDRPNARMGLEALAATGPAPIETPREPPESAALAPVVPDPTGDPFPSALAALIERLEARAQESPESYPQQARAELTAFHTAQGRVPHAERVAGVSAALDHRAPDEPVSHALLVLLGAWGAETEALAHAGQVGRPLHAALLGCGWPLEPGQGDPGLAIDPTNYVKFQPRLEPLPLDGAFERVPAPELEPLLIELALRPVWDRLAIQDRDVAILALGSAVDRGDAVLDLFARILGDSSEAMAQAWPPVLFVLTRSQRPEARALLERVLADPALGVEGRALVGNWRAETAGGREILLAAAATLEDPGTSSLDRGYAVNSLVKRIQAGVPEEQPLIAELLSLHITREQDETLRMATVAMLGTMAGGEVRMASLVHALIGDPAPRVRTAAARAMPRALAHERPEALQHLHAARLRETDAGVLAAIEKAIAALEAAVG